MNQKFFTQVNDHEALDKAIEGNHDWWGQGEITVDALRTSEGHSPLFIIANAQEWASVADFTLDALDDKGDVYRLAVSRRSVLCTVQGMAAAMLATIQNFRTTGRPVQILGIGAYAKVAYELGVQCLMRDQELGFFGVLDNGADYENQYAALAQEHFTQCHMAACRVYEIEPSKFVVHWIGSSQRLLAKENPWTKSLPSDKVKVWELGATGSDDSCAMASCGKVLAQAMRHASSLKDNCATRQTYLSAVPIQAGSAGGDFYFCFPGAGASVIDFVPFSSAIGNTHRVYGMQPRGLCGVLPPYGSVEAAARVHVAEIRNLSPNAPIHLVGHSFGGWIAFEVASRLQRLGRVASSLTLLDSEPPSVSARVGYEYTRAQAIMELVSLYEQAAGQPLRLRREDFECLGLLEQLSLLHGQLVRVGLLSAKSPPSLLQGTLKTFEAAIRTRYRPTARFGGSTQLVLVRDAEESDEMADARNRRVLEAWQLMAPDVECLHASGNHMTLLKMPHIAEVARWMRSSACV